jgi:FkbM family methyltransferase
MKLKDNLEEHYEKRKIPMEVSFDEKENKIHFNYQSDRNRYVQIVLRDIDTWLSIYTWTQELVDYNSSFWAIPIPARIFRFGSEPGFNGFRIEYYEIQPDIESDIYLERNKMCRLKSVSDRLLDVQELRLRNNNPTMPFRYKIQNPLHSLTYFTYMTFFYQKIYEDFNFGKDSVVVDVGANIGTFTMYALHRGASKVYALEPVQSAFDDLNNTLKSDKVVPLQIAISDSNGELDMYTIPWNDTMASFDKNHIVQHSQDEQDIISFKVKTQKFVDFMYEQNLEKIDLLKVDIEGAEYMMFDAIDDNTLMKVDRLLLEFHDNYNGEFRKHILDKLDKTGFEYTFYQQADGKIQTTEEDHHGIMWAERTRQDIGVLMMYDGFNFGEFSKDNSFFMGDWLAMEAGSIYYDILKNVKDGDVVLDIGASTGVISWLAVSSGKKLKHIYMVEPYPTYNEILKENFKDVDNWTLIKKIVSDKEGETKLNWGLAPDNTILPCTTFKKIVEDIPRVDVLKIDIEEGEYDIFTEENLEYLNNCVGNIVVEFHTSLPESKEKFRNFRDNYLGKLNKEIEVFSLDSVDIKWDLWNEHFIEYYDMFMMVLYE